MKKIAIMSTLFFGVLFLAGCGQQQTQTNQSANQPAAPETKTENKIISSIADAIGLGQKMKCTYKTTMGDGKTLESTAMIEGKKFKSESTLNGIKQVALSDGENMYTWSENEKKGMKFSFACAEEIKTKFQDQSAKGLASDVQDNFKNATETNCVSASSVDFTVPTDITFTDQCEMMKNAMGTLNNLPKNIPVPTAGKMPANIPVPQL